MKTRKPYNKNWPRKNLGEVVNFLDRQYPEGYSLKQLSEKLGMTCQNISQMFIRDDMKLSRAEAIAQAYGYRLKLYFPVRERIGLDYSVRKVEYVNAGNLSGLAKYIYDSNISLTNMSQRTGRSYNVFFNAFSTGNISIATMYQIIKNLKIDVVWSFEKDGGEERS